MNVDVSGASGPCSLRCSGRISDVHRWERVQPTHCSCRSERQDIVLLEFKRFYLGALMRFGTIAALCVFAFMVVGASAESVPTCADLKLVPAVRECTAVKAIPIGSIGLRIVSGRKTLRTNLPRTILRSRSRRGAITVGKANAVTIRLLRVIPEHGKESLEEYRIAPTAARGLSVTAQTDARTSSMVRRL